MTEQPSPAATESPSFEEALDQLDGLIREMESGDLGLAESMAAYEQGVGLLRQLHEKLSDVERRVQTLVRIDDDGNPVFADADPTSSSAGEAAGTTTATSKRTSRRPRAKKATASGQSRQRLPGMDDPLDNS